MQRYQINYKLLFGLVAAFMLIGGVCFFLIHPWQVNRNAEWFRERADTAMAEDDVRTAFDYQSKYVRYRQDETDARIKMANLAIEVAELTDANAVDRANAFVILQDAVLKTNDAELRKKYADFLIAGSSPADAIPHIDELLNNEPGNSELQAMRVRSLFATKDFRRAVEVASSLIGYDQNTETFDEEKAVAADQPEIYTLLANALVEHNNELDQARQVIERMIEVNPDSYKAYLNRSLFLARIGEEEEAAESLAKAYELEPSDAEILLLKGRAAIKDEDYDLAYQFLTEGLEENPKVLDFYNLLSLIEIQRGNAQAGLDILDRGIKELGASRSADLIVWKINALIQTEDIDSVEKEVERLENLDYQYLQPVIEYQRARVAFYKKNWAKAARDFKQLRPRLYQFPKLQTTCGVLLGAAYENLGQKDLAAQTYDLVLQDKPDDPRALAGRQRVSKQPFTSASKYSVALGVTSLVRQMKALPEHLQDWQSIDDRIKEHCEENDFPKTVELLYQAQVFLDREMYDKAREKIREANVIDPKNVNVQLAAVRLMWIEPHTDLEKALNRLTQVEKDYGVTLKSRTQRAEIITRAGGEDVVEKLQALTEDIEDWSDRDKLGLYVILGRSLTQLGEVDAAHDFWNQAALTSPNNLPVRMELFEKALQMHDDQAMQDAQEKILELVGSKNDASYIVTEVRRQMFAFSKELISKEELRESRKLLDQALLQRPEWNELHIIYGTLLVLLQEDFEVANQHLNDALVYGPPNMKVVSLHVRLLASQKRFGEAWEKMKLIPESMYESLLGKTAAEVLLETGNLDAAYQLAQSLAEKQDNVHSVQKWFASLANRAGKADSAIATWRKAIELNPEDPDSWSQLMIILAQQKNAAELQKVLREANLALNAEYIPMLAAKSYELQGRWRNAENIYLAAYREELDKIRRARRLAEFYLLWKSQDPENVKKAGKYLNEILTAYYDGEIKPHQQAYVDWARKQAARLLVAAKDYQKSQQALELLLQGEVDGQLPAEDSILRAEILASLKDPISQAEAVKALSDLKAQGKLDTRRTLLLAKLLHAVNDWEASQNLMIDTLAKNPTDYDVRVTFAGLLIEHGEFDLAQSRLNRLRDSNEDRLTYLRLLARFHFKKGDQTGVNEAIQEMVPDPNKETLDPTELATLRSAAILAAEYGEIDLADQLYARYVKAVPTAAYERIRFLALHGDADVAIEQMQKLMPQLPDIVVSLASQMLRKRRAEFGDKYDEAVDKMIATALRDDPDSAHRRLAQAEILEIQNKHEESVAAYDKLLSRSDVPDRERAAASNNLAFLLALRGERLDEAESLVNIAIDFYGPLAGLLDTRGMVRLAQQKSDLAVEDLSLASTVDRQPVTLFHLARALLVAGDKEAALRRWQEAKEQGLEESLVPELEKAAYQQFASEIQQTGTL